MSLTIAILSLFVFGYRLKKGLVSREEKILWLMWLLHLLIVLPLTMMVRVTHTFETRYLKPVDCFVWGAVVWALFKIKYGRYFVYGVLSFLVAYNCVMFTKHLVPGSRRNANLIACDWAQNKIKADWNKHDTSASKVFTINEYTSGGSPSISPISKRMNYLLGARNANAVFGKKFGTPDYIVEEDKRLMFEPWDKEDYVLMDELQIKKRHYSLFKRKNLKR